MIYKINNKYYVKTSACIYTEIQPTLKGNTVTLKPLKNKIETNANTKIKKVVLDDIAKELKREKTSKFYE